MARFKKNGTKKLRGIWHYYTTKDGRKVLRDPNGRDLHGTAAEIREARLMPDTLRGLRRSLRMFGIKPDSVEAAEMRQEAIHFDLGFRRMNGESIPVSCDEYILLNACARYMRKHGETKESFFRNAVRSLIEGTIELALIDGLPELPLTRDERRALRCRQSDFCDTLIMREAKAAGAFSKGKEVAT